MINDFNIIKGEKKMTKKDLKNGMIVELRNGMRYLYCEGVMRGLDEWNVMSNYTDNLNNTKFQQLDIVKVYKDTRKYNLNTIFEYEFLKLIWKRPETLKLSEREIEVLKALDVLGFTYITRDFEDKSLVAHVSKPIKRQFIWGCVYEAKFLETNLFDFITFADKEPTNILNLLSVLN